MSPAAVGTGFAPDSELTPLERTIKRHVMSIARRIIRDKDVYKSSHTFEMSRVAFGKEKLSTERIDVC